MPVPVPSRWMAHSDGFVLRLAQGKGPMKAKAPAPAPAPAKAPAKAVVPAPR